MKAKAEKNIQQVFALRIIKDFDPVTNNVKLEIKSKSDGMPASDALMIVEGWCKAEKEKLLFPLFGKRKQ